MWALLFLLVLPVNQCKISNEHNQENWLNIELVLVINKQIYESFDNDTERVYNICSDIVSIVNSIYHPLNISVALVDLVIWSEKNFFEVSDNVTETLLDFLEYRRKYLVSEHPNDSAFLMVEKLNDDVLGVAIPDSICSYKYSGGVVFLSSDIEIVAMTMAHEIAHTFGVIHDTPECECKTNSCIMTDGLDLIVPHFWSTCSIDQINLAISRGMDYCLREKPIPLLKQCGNGFVERGEQCDCGLEGHCENSCCNPMTCMLQPNATCASGSCCNLSVCDLHTASKECRKSKSECDIPEFCSGESEYCPDDVYKRNTEPCNKAKSYCYEGVCESHTQQCKLLWGSSGHSFDKCYINNLEGTQNGDCGYSLTNQIYQKCARINESCGRLQCTHWSKHLQYGWENNAIFSQSNVVYKGSTITCQTVSIDMGLQNVDPGMVPDGAKCGIDGICIRQACVSVGEYRSENFIVDCPENCFGHGMCDNVGQCHCHVGFEPPLCKSPIPGGSAIDKGDLSVITYIILFGVLPFLALALFGVFIWKWHSKLRSCFVHSDATPAEQLSAPTILETEV